MKHLSRAWAAPVTLLGLMLALVLSVIARTRWQVVAGVIEVAPRDGCHAIGARCWQKLPFDAITLGHVVIGSSTSCLQALREHEHAHVRQCERWGVFLLIAYPLASAFMLLTGRRPYLDNPFEVQAREAGARGTQR